MQERDRWRIYDVLLGRELATTDESLELVYRHWPKLLFAERMNWNISSNLDWTYSLDHRRIAAYSHHPAYGELGTIEVWQLDSERNPDRRLLVTEARYTFGAPPCCFSRTGNVLVIHDSTRHLLDVWDVESGDHSHQAATHEAIQRLNAATQDGRFAVVAFNERRDAGWVRLCDGNLLAILTQDHPAPDSQTRPSSPALVEDRIMSPDERWLLEHTRYAIYVWHLPYTDTTLDHVERPPTYTWRTDNGRIYAAEFSPGSDVVYAVCDGGLQAWSLHTGLPLFPEPEAPTGDVRAVEFAGPDDVAVYFFDNVRAVVLDADSGSPRFAFHGEHRIESIAVSPERDCAYALLVTTSGRHVERLEAGATSPIRTAIQLAPEDESEQYHLQVDQQTLTIRGIRNATTHTFDRIKQTPTKAQPPPATPLPEPADVPKLVERQRAAISPDGTRAVVTLGATVVGYIRKPPKENQA